MKAILYSTAVLLALGTPALAETTAKPVCIYTRDVQSSRPAMDERSITFTMRNGQRWRNDLKGRCTGVYMNGFVWVLRGNDMVCDNLQTLSVPNGGVCVLGKFTALPKLASNTR